MDCVEGKEQRKPGWMFWGVASGALGTGPYLFWDKKEWGNIGAQTYIDHTLLVLEAYLKQHPLDFIQDNCSGHGAKKIMAYMDSIGLVPLEWPSNSPDLNLIETVWCWIKEYIHVNYSGSHRPFKRPREQVEEAWHSINDSGMQELVKTMPDRVRAVVEANGWHTKSLGII